jgi:molybdopterin converting factor small subunit
MHIRVRYFAYFREQLGRGSEEVDLPEGSDVAALWQQCVAGHPTLRRLWEAIGTGDDGADRAVP